MKQIFTPQVIRWIAASSVFAAASAILLFSPSRLEYPAPIYLTHLSEIIDSLIMAMIFYAAIGLGIGNRGAWRAAILILSLSIIWGIIESSEGVTIVNIPPLFALIVVGASRRYYQLRSEPSGLLLALRRALVFTITSTIVACLGIYVITLYEHRSFKLLPSILETLNHMYNLQTIFEPIHTVTLSHIFERSIVFTLGVINYLLIAFALVRPLLDTFNFTPHIHRRVRDYLHAYAEGSDDYFQYWPADKSYFFSNKVEGFVAYGVHHNICVAIANPITPDLSTLLAEFKAYCLSHGWQPVFLPVNENSRKVYRQAGFDSIKIGESAVVNIARFSSETRRNKHFRNVYNRFTKAGFKAGYIIPETHLSELERVSDSWVNHKGRQERQFLMGYFNANYLKESRIFAAQDSTGAICAFVNLHPNYSPVQASIDLIRISPDAPSNTIDYLLMELITTLSEEGWQTFDLGLSPLSGLDTARLHERNLTIIYKYANRWFGFIGLRRFKEKFSPNWESRYLMHTGSASRLPRIAVAVNTLLRYKSNRDDTLKKVPARK